MEKFDPENFKEVEFHGGGLNTSDEQVLEQVNINIRRGLPQVHPHDPNPKTIALVCGGPSLNETIDELVEAVWSGASVCAVNGAYNWCIDHNIKPSLMVLLDAREFNARFVERPVPGCRYLLASQCHPKAFDYCKDRDVHIWHACSTGEGELELLKKFYFSDEKFIRTYPVTMGTTVTLRAISLLRLLGFYSLDCFGFDSCWLDGVHHAYSQPENKDRLVKIWLRPEGRDDKAVPFDCAPWHIKQAMDIQELIRERGNMFRLNVRGRGLIATLLRTSAEIEIEGAQTQAAE